MNLGLRRETSHHCVFSAGKTRLPQSTEDHLEQRQPEYVPWSGRGGGVPVLPAKTVVGEPASLCDSLPEQEDEDEDFLLLSCQTRGMCSGVTLPLDVLC